MLVLPSSCGSCFFPQCSSSILRRSKESEDSRMSIESSRILTSYLKQDIVFLPILILIWSDQSRRNTYNISIHIHILGDDMSFSDQACSESNADLWWMNGEEKRALRRRRRRRRRRRTQERWPIAIATSALFFPFRIYWEKNCTVSIYQRDKTQV